jgi:hypothetical protein
MKQRAVTWSAVVVSLSLSLGAAHAMEIVALKEAPSWYATEVVEKDQTGKDVRRYVHGTQPVAISMADIHRILAAYGLSVVDARQAPGYITEIVLTDKGERTFVFDSEPKGMAPAAVDGILKAYGLRVVDAKALPPRYGRAVVTKDADGKDVEGAVLGSEAYAWSPAEWHSILSAYGK